jgi:hypothetical protein
MVTTGLAWSSVIGLLQVLGALAYFMVSITQIIAALRERQSSTVVPRFIQLIFVPLMLLMSGIILFFNGWRLDPILQFQQLLLGILIGHLVLQDLRR